MYKCRKISQDVLLSEGKSKVQDIVYGMALLFDRTSIKKIWKDIQEAVAVTCGVISAEG